MQVKDTQKARNEVRIATNKIAQHLEWLGNLSRTGLQGVDSQIFPMWYSPEPDLCSFAAITDDPPPEIAATGHNRMIISIKEANVADWLRPQGMSETRLQEILSDRERLYYEHRIAA